MFRIRNISIHTYKNLDGTYSFGNSTNYLALIGLNGSGKSNLLEAISIIFDMVINHNGDDMPFDFSIEYEIDGHFFSINKTDAKNDGVIINAAHCKYPTSIISCYSGEDLRLWHNAFEEYHMRYFNDAVKKEYSSPSFLYVNKYCWKIALIALICSNNPDVKVFLSNLLKIEKPEDVDISFSLTAKAEANKKNYRKHSALKWFNTITQDGLEMINMNLVDSTDINVANRQISNEEKSKFIFNFLYILSQPKKNKVNKIDKLIDEIHITLNHGEFSINFDDLSEGEKKLILIECITKVLGDENSLVLLDEPDAHTHIAMKKDLLKLISEFEGQTIFTTHSPMFVKMIKDDNQDNLYYIENGKITESRNNLIKKLSSDTLTVLDGTLYSTSNSYLLVEGKSDVNCIKAAIERFPEYEKLRDVSIISFNGASEAKVFFEQAFQPSMECVNKVVFLFDYDQAGLISSKQIEPIEQAYPDKCYRLFYRKNYDENNIPASIDNSSSILLEDLVSPDAYHSEIEQMHSITSFHQLHVNGNITEKPIKNLIETKCKFFSREQLRDFAPLLQKLYSIFDLQ